MSEESRTPDVVELVRRAIDASHRGDYDAIMRLFAPDVVWDSLDGLGTFEGATAVRGFLEEVTGMFEDFTIKVESVVDLGSGIVYSVYHQEGRVPGSTGFVTARGVLISEWTDGMVARVIASEDNDEARAAAERLARELG